MDQWILLQEGIYIYVALFLLLMGGAFLLPIPEDIPLILGGVLAQAGKAQWQMVALVCYLSIVLGDVVIYLIGKKIGPALFQKNWFRRRLSSSKIRKLRFKLEKRSIPMIFVARHLFYLRTATFLTCGAVRMKFSRFLLADVLAALVSVPLMVGLGYLAAQHYDTVFLWVKQAKYWSVVIVAMILASYFVYHRYRARQCSSERDNGENGTADR